MEQQNELTVQTPLQQSLAETGTLAKQIEEVYPKMIDRSMKGKLALSAITAITSDEEDKKAMEQLVKVRNTIDGFDNNGNRIKGIKEERMLITGRFDALKSILMVPEKELIDEAVRVKTLRDGYANKKIREQQEREAAILARKNEANEIARVTAEIKERIIEAGVKAIRNFNESLQIWIASMNLDNWEEKVSRFNAKPNLMASYYEECFLVPYNKNFISEEIFKGIVAEVKKSVPYEKVNGDYIAYATPILEEEIKGLPAKKERLENLKRLEETNAIQAAVEKRRMDEEEEKRKTTMQENLDRHSDSRLAEVREERDEATLQNEFASQVETQATEVNQKGLRKTRVALIDAEPAQMAKVISKVVFACLSNPKFEGILKRKKGTVVPNDAQGFPVYADWLAPLLDFIAKEQETPIEGIKFDQRTSTVAKKSDS